jgi:hypothetical protein
MKDPVEQKFLETLADIPPLPDTVFDGVRSTVRRRSAVRYSALAMAASLLLALGGLQAYRSFIPAPAVSQDVVDELQHVGEYLNGNTVGAELPVYVSLEDN